MSIKAIQIFWVFSFLISSPASAANEVTIATEIKPIFADGDLEGCALNFEAGRSDTEYNSGAMTYIQGSLNYYLFPNRPPMFALKLGVTLSKLNGAQAPTQAYLLSEYGTNKGDFLKAVDGETPGFRMFAFKAGDSTLEATQGIFKSGKLVVGYAMNGGATIAAMPIDLTLLSLNFDNPNNSVVDERAPGKWKECVIKASDAAIARMKK